MNKILQTPFQRFNDFGIDKQWNIFKIHFISCDVSPDSCVERYCVEFWYSRHSSLQYTVVTSIWHTIFCYPFFFHRDLLFFFSCYFEWNGRKDNLPTVKRYRHLHSFVQNECLLSVFIILEKIDLTIPMWLVLILIHGQNGYFQDFNKMAC